MYKRAFLFSSNAPLTLDQGIQPEDGQGSQKDDENRKDSGAGSDAEETEVIKQHPGNKVSYCIYCKGKTFLNQESVDKHVRSKKHLKNVKKNEKEGERAERIKKEFLLRMMEVDRKSLRPAQSHFKTRDSTT